MADAGDTRPQSSPDPLAKGMLSDAVKSEPEDSGLRAAALPNRSISPPKTSDLRKVSEVELRGIETAQAYAEDFHRLQLKPERWDLFFNGVVRVIRQKHVLDVKRCTASSVKNLTTLLLRGFGYKIWHPPETEKEWLRELEDGETRLVHERKGANERFYPILGAMWHRMRDIIFVERSTPKKRGPGKGSKYNTHARRLEDYSDDTHPTTFRPSHDDIRAQTLRKTEELQEHTLDFEEMTTRPVEPPNFDRIPRGRKRISSDYGDTFTFSTLGEMTVYGHQFMSAAATEEAIVNLIVRLSQIRARSEPEIFERLWEANVGRVEELDQSHENDIPAQAHSLESDGGDEHEQLVQASPSTTSPAMNDPPSTRQPANKSPSSTLNLSNEPFATHGNPERPRFPLRTLLPPRLPETMTIYISTHPASDAGYTNRSYIWPDAPVMNPDRERFFRGIDARVTVNVDCVKGWVLSYGWNDVMRWIQNPSFDCHRRRMSGEESPFDTTADEGVGRHEEGWNVFQKDLKLAAENGVGIWRCKVLVVSE